VFPGKGGVLPTAAQKASGDALTATLQAPVAHRYGDTPPNWWVLPSWLAIGRGHRPERTTPM
jgi:hypothetical protein